MIHKSYHPRYWGIWLLLAIMRLLVYLPYRWQLLLGKYIGKISYYIAPYRRHVTATNIKLCFPQLNKNAQRQLIKKCFMSAGMGMMEVAMAWWMSAKRIQKLTHFKGLEYLEKAKASNKNIIMAGAHFTCLEIAGRICGEHEKFHLLYRPHKNFVFNHIMEQKRKQFAKSIISKHDLRTLLTCIKSKVPVWYAPDQDYGKKHSAFAPFFSIPTASITIMSRLAQQTNAILLPVFYHRLPDNQGYEIIIHPALENYPSGDPVVDASQFNQLLENDLRQYPEQYLWQHRRFKNRPDGEKSVYYKKNDMPTFMFITGIFNP